MVRSFALTIGIALAAAAGTLQLAVAQPANSYSPAPSDMAQPTGYYSPQYTMAQPSGYYPSPQYTMAQRPTYFTAGSGYGSPSPSVPNGAPGGNYVAPRSMGAAGGGLQTVATPTTPQASGGNVAPTPMGATVEGSMGSGCEGGMGGPWHRGWNGVDMPQHYAYYPPMHGYYYFRPYHYTHVPTQQGFATQFGVDPRNPYSNDFFKVVYAEYRASLLRASPENLGVPSGVSQQGIIETPADTIKKLKALKDDGVLSQEEFDSKKSEILGRM